MKMNKRETIGMISIIILLSLSYLAASSDSNEFDSTINIATSTAKGLTVALIEPDMDQYGLGNTIGFKAVASYNKSLDLSCELLVDNNVIDSMTVTDGNELIVSKKFTFNIGTHSWSMRCMDELNDSAKSSEKRFIVDLQGPSIKLSSSPSISFNDYMDLAFTPTDDYSSDLDCDVFINSVKNESVDASNNQEKKVTIKGLMDGVYSWNVKCKDDLGNEGSGSESSFIVDTKRNFSILTNKESYGLGEKGVYYIKAPEGSKAKVLITNPRGATTVKNVNGPFPAIDDMGPFDYVGDYKIEAYITLDGAVKQTSKKVTADNNMHVSIKDIEKKTYLKGSTVSFSAEGSGGIGSLTYTWNFKDDDSEVAGATASHTYNSFGSFDAIVTAKDSNDNKISNSVRINIQEPYPVKIMVVDDITGSAIPGAIVYLDGKQESTDSLGVADYNIFEGKYSLIVKKDSYKVYARDINIQRNLTARASLERLNGNVSIGSSESYAAEDYEGARVEDDKGSIEIDTEKIAAEIKSVLTDIDNYISSISDGEEVKALKIREGLESARSKLNMANKDLLNLKVGSISMTKEEAISRVKAIEEDIQDIKATTIRSFEIEDSNEVIMVLSDSEVDMISEEYLKSIDAEYTNSQLKSLQQDNKKIRSLLSVDRKYLIGNIVYISGDSEPITLVVDKIGLKERVPDSSLLLYVPKDIASSAKDMGIITDSVIINDDPLIQFSIGEKDIVYYFKKQLAKEDMDKVLPLLLSSGEERASSGITGFAIMPSLGEIDNPLLLVEIIIIVILVITFIVYQFELVDKIRSASGGNEFKDINKNIKETRYLLNRKDLDKAGESYTNVAKAFKGLSPKSRSKIEPKVKELDKMMVYARLDDEADKALGYLREGRVTKAKASYRMIQGIYKELPKEYKAKACKKCDILIKKLSLE